MSILLASRVTATDLVIRLENFSRMSILDKFSSLITNAVAVSHASVKLHI